MNTETHQGIMEGIKQAYLKTSNALLKSETNVGNFKFYNSMIRAY